MNKEQIEEQLKNIRASLCKCENPCWSCKYVIWDKDAEWICSFEYIIEKMNESSSNN